MNIVEMNDLKTEIKNVFDGEVRFDEPMSLHTSLKIGGPGERTDPILHHVHDS